MRRFSFFTLFIILHFQVLFAQPEKVVVYEVDEIKSLAINGSINPATYNYLKSAFKENKDKQNQVFIIEINTPGGLVSTTKDILTMFGNSDSPIIVWIRPEGASATSAGAIIASGAHLLFMSNGTNIGAATPVSMGKDIEKQSDMRKKSVNDLVALVTGLSEARGRNPTPFAQMVKEAKSFNTSEAKKLNLINGIANTRSELIKLLDAQVFDLKGKPIKLKLNHVEFKNIEMDLGQKLLNIFANPTMAYMLFIIGAALLYLELQTPGGFIAGSIGVMALILAAIGFQVLPLNFGALGLIVLSFVLFILEVFITSYGILSIGGMASLIAGSLFLFRTDNSYLEFSHGVIYGAVAAIGVFIFGMGYLFSRDHKNIGKEQFNGLIGKQATILSSELQLKINLYKVKVGGEIWSAQSETKYEKGQKVTILKQDNNQLKLII